MPKSEHAQTRLNQDAWEVLYSPKPTSWPFSFRRACKRRICSSASATGWTFPVIIFIERISRGKEDKLDGKKHLGSLKLQTPLLHNCLFRLKLELRQPCKNRKIWTVHSVSQINIQHTGIFICFLLNCHALDPNHRLINIDKLSSRSYFLHHWRPSFFFFTCDQNCGKYLRLVAIFLVRGAVDGAVG